MMPDQTESAAAWATVFGDTNATTRVLDDMTAFCNGLSESQQPGAVRLLLYLLTKRTQQRRAARERKTKT